MTLNDAECRQTSDELTSNRRSRRFLKVACSSSSTRISASAQDSLHHRGGLLTGVGIGRLVGDTDIAVGAEVDADRNLE